MANIMNNKKKSILSKALGVFSGAKETVNNYAAARTAVREANKNVNTLAINKAKKMYSSSTGKEMTPSLLKSEAESGMMSKESRGYLSNKKKIGDEYRKKFKL